MLQGSKTFPGAVMNAADYISLGLDYSTGRGVPVDYVEAHKWLNLAAMDGNEEARRLRAEIAQDMTAEEIADAQRRAREWRQSRIH